MLRERQGGGMLGGEGGGRGVKGWMVEWVAGRVGRLSESVVREMLEHP